MLTRREVIELWEKNEKHLDLYVCSNCRDLMYKMDVNKYVCRNEECANFDLVIEAK